jgi:N-methylhydantoinase A
MIAFGGSGPVHAMGVARKLGIPRVIFPVAAGVMSALGLLASPLTFEVARTRQVFVDDLTAADFAATLAALEAEAMTPLLEANTEADALSVRRRLDMRYHGQGHEIEVTLPQDVKVEALAGIFREHYAAVHGAALLDAPLVVTTWKVEASAAPPTLATAPPRAQGQATAKATRQAYFGEDYIATPVYDRQSLSVGAVINGPALIEERESTAIIGPGDTVEVDEYGNLVAELETSK